MKTCLKCNVSYSDDKKFCKQCGQLLTSGNEHNPMVSVQLSVFEDKLKADPLNVKLLLDYAQFLQNNSKYKESIILLLKVLVIDEKNVLVHKLLFKAYIKNKDYNEALETGEKLLKNIPDNLNLLADLSEIALKANSERKASQFIERILEINPKDKDALIKKASIISTNGSEKDVFEAWSKVYEIDPSNPAACFQVAINNCDNKNKYRQTVDLLEKVLYQLKDDNRSKADLYYCYALLKTDQSDIRIPESIDNVDTEKCSNSNNPRIKEMLHEIYIYQGKSSLSGNHFEEALTYLYQAQKNSQDLITKKLIAEVHFKYSIEKLKQSALSEAEEQINEAIDLDPENEDFKTQLNDILLNIKRAKRKKNNMFLLVAVAFFCIIISVPIYKNIKEKNEWNLSKRLNTFNSYQKYLNEYHNGKYSSEAITLQEDALWGEAKQFNSVEIIEKFLSLYNNGMHTDSARIIKADIIWDKAKELNTIEAYKEYLSKSSGIYFQYDNIAHSKIDSINNISPNIERIKNDLLGQQISGWNFAYLNEFLESEILKVTKGSQTIEYTIRFKLIDNGNNNKYDCEVLIIYNKGDQGWYFNSVLSNYFTLIIQYRNIFDPQ